MNPAIRACNCLLRSAIHHAWPYAGDCRSMAACVLRTMLAQPVARLVQPGGSRREAATAWGTRYYAPARARGAPAVESRRLGSDLGAALQRCERVVAVCCDGGVMPERVQLQVCVSVLGGQCCCYSVCLDQRGWGVRPGLRLFNEIVARCVIT